MASAQSFRCSLTQAQLKRLLIPFAASFVVALVCIILCCLLGASFRAGNLYADSHVAIQGSDFNGHCEDCNSRSVYVMVCAKTPNEVWERVADKTYYIQEGKALDSSFWCGVSDLGEISQDAHAVVWPIVLALVLCATAIFFDNWSEPAYRVGQRAQAKWAFISILIYLVPCIILWCIANASDTSPNDSSATVIYVFSMVSLSCYVPGRVMLEQGRFFERSLTNSGIVAHAILLIPTVIYCSVLVISLGMTGRIFHSVDDLWGGFGWCFLYMLIVVLAYVIFEEIVNRRRQKLAQSSSEASQGIAPAEIGAVPVKEKIIPETAEKPPETIEGNENLDYQQPAAVAGAGAVAAAGPADDDLRRHDGILLVERRDGDIIVDETPAAAAAGAAAAGSAGAALLVETPGSDICVGDNWEISV